MSNTCRNSQRVNVHTSLCTDERIFFQPPTPRRGDHIGGFDVKIELGRVRVGYILNA